MNDFSIDNISRKKEELKKVEIELKNKFFGIDSVIEQIIKNIEAWYTIPDILTHPTIVCLWGPTGVGKTDLVRTLVKLINFQDKFCEIILQGDHSPSSPYSRTISCILDGSNVRSQSPSVILLDEIQGFRTVSKEGDDIDNYKFKDVWGLLSDGKLPHDRSMDTFSSLLWDIKKREEGNDKNNIDKLDDDEYWELKNFKKYLRLEEPIEEIAKWPLSERKRILLSSLTKKNVFEEDDYSKSLIFISGNLDEAYPFCEDVCEVDIDADTYHKQSLDINLIDIKKALGKRFKPEQISRFGNRHVIYPSLNKKTFEKIIDNKIQKTVEFIKTKNIHIQVDDSIRKAIYDNGVFPAQGTRPVLSTISSVFEGVIPDILMESLSLGSDNVIVSYENGNIVGTIKDKKIYKPFIGAIDSIRDKNKKDLDMKTIYSIHEAGHAVVFASLFGESPLQIISNSASTERGGFVNIKSVALRKDIVLNRIRVVMAGVAAEEIVFGIDQISSGSEGDVVNATKFAASMIRKWGMFEYSTKISNDSNVLSNNDIEGSNSTIDSIVSACRNDAKNILSHHIELLKETSDCLIEKGMILPEEFCEICKKHELDINVPDKSDDLYIKANYNELYQEFKSKKKIVDFIR